jgi:transcriptional regulator with XRE-family HTH domain
MEAERLTDAALAERIGSPRSRSQINRVRRRAANPSFELALKLQGVSGIPAGELLAPERAPLG